ncbi:hypothetical protein [Natrarchaeobius chitinivorans]|uniref:Uncharacterized protein n=1 Tax=Natrarchaeobius chitinivorans TaxID=1679083 RepID=A0A3N6M0H0_NATCH|nr:hypothetical protein [Natrarchaeobius chitinivorans]RQG95067.1 hypothetical protein EA473_08890 [Natrarchaeobius chitinivorans]
MVRRLAILLAAVLLAVSLVGFAAATGTPEPVVTIENEDDVSHHVTAYTIEDMDTAGYLNFEVTTEDGEQRLVSFADLVWPNYDRNVTLVDEGIASHEIEVDPGENTTTALEGWEHGDVTIYVVEEGENRTHVSTRPVTCESRGQEHRLTLSDGSGMSSSAICGGGISWLWR